MLSVLYPGPAPTDGARPRRLSWRKEQLRYGVMQIARQPLPLLQYGGLLGLFIQAAEFRRVRSARDPARDGPGAMLVLPPCAGIAVR